MLVTAPLIRIASPRLPTRQIPTRPKGAEGCRREQAGTREGGDVDALGGDLSRLNT